jgi:sulfotransferase family protein
MTSTLKPRSAPLGSESWRRLTKRGIASGFFRSDLFRSILTTKNYASSYYEARMHPDAFKTVQAYCVFIGHMKSGGSMIGSLLDAHPNAILADEVDALRYVRAGFTRDQIFHVLVRASRKELLKGRVTARRLTPYSWFVPSQWQGRYTTLRVIGDSTTGSSTQQLGEYPRLLERLAQVMKGVELKFIHVIRNPFDPMSVMMVRGKRSFEMAFAHYFRSCAMLLDLRRSLDASNLISVKYEDFVSHPVEMQTSICTYLGLEAPADYLAACSSILHETPEQSRRLVAWEPRWVDMVEEKIPQFDFLAGYSFGN